jgi:CheY-like chemotaxis protein
MRTKERKQKHWRLFGGIIISLALVVILIIHITAAISLDEISIALLVLVIGSMIFAFSDKFGIATIKAGSLEFALEIPVERAVTNLPTGQVEDVWRILKKHADLFPVIGIRLLWVDDKPETLIPQRALLRQLGFEVVATSTTKAALSELRDGDFIVILQDQLRNGSSEDARALIQWLHAKGKDYKVKNIPVVMFTWDSFNATMGIQPRDWITKDFSILLERIATEVELWHKAPLVVRNKPLTV